MWREPLDKYDLIDNMNMLNQRELDRLDSLVLDPEISSSASREKMRRTGSASELDEGSKPSGLAGYESENTKDRDISDDNITDVSDWKCPKCGEFLRLDIYDDTINVDFHCKSCGHRLFSITASR